MDDGPRIGQHRFEHFSTDLFDCLSRDLNFKSGIPNDSFNLSFLRFAAQDCSEFDSIAVLGGYSEPAIRGADRNGLVGTNRYETEGVKARRFHRL